MLYLDKRKHFATKETCKIMFTLRAFSENSSDKETATLGSRSWWISIFLLAFIFLSSCFVQCDGSRGDLTSMILMLQSKRYQSLVVPSWILQLDFITAWFRPLVDYNVCRSIYKPIRKKRKHTYYWRDCGYFVKDPIINWLLP